MARDAHQFRAAEAAADPTLVVPVVNFVLVLRLCGSSTRTKPGLAMPGPSPGHQTTPCSGCGSTASSRWPSGSAPRWQRPRQASCGPCATRRSSYMGIFPGFKAFIAAVLGGIGSIQERHDRRAAAQLHRDHDRGLHAQPVWLPRRVRLRGVLVLVLLVRPTGTLRGSVRRKRYEDSMRSLLLHLAAIEYAGPVPCLGGRPTSTATRSRSSISSP